MVTDDGNDVTIVLSPIMGRPGVTIVLEGIGNSTFTSLTALDNAGFDIEIV